MFGKKIKAPRPHNQLTTMDIVRQYLMSKIPKPKIPASQPIQPPSSAPPGIAINHIAIILDGRVEDVIRCQNRLAALLLSEPKFVDFNPEEIAITVGLTEYGDGKFTTKMPEPEPPLTQEEIEKILLDVSGPEALND
jgi:hypothetical protein